MKLFFLFLALFLCSCAHKPQELILAQKGGSATGAGATLSQPNNSAAPSKQTSIRKIWYPDQASPSSVPVAPVAVESPIPSPVVPVIPIFVEEYTESELGAHQEVSGIVEMAVKASQWTWLRWVGVVCTLAGIGGWLWSMGNPMGFSLVFVGIAACGVVFMLASSNPAWLLLLGAPFGFYAFQKVQEEAQYKDNRPT